MVSTVRSINMSDDVARVWNGMAGLIVPMGR